AIPGCSLSSAFEVVFDAAVGEIPENDDGVVGEYEGYRTSRGELSSALVRLGPRDPWVATLAGGPSPPAVLRLFESEVLLDVVVHFFLAPAQGKRVSEHLGAHVGVGTEVGTVVDAPLGVAGNDQSNRPFTGDSIP